MAKESIIPQSTARKVRELIQLPFLWPWHLLVPLVLITSVAVGAGLMLKKKYKSYTVILVERDQVPANMVPRLLTTNGGQRLSTLRQEVLSRTRLERINEELDPFPELRARPNADVVSAMRGSIAIQIRGNDAFSIEFVHSSPTMAQAVTERLATLFIEEASEMRTKQVADATAFIEQELEESRKELEAKEDALRQYKETRMGTLPEQLNSNLATLARLQREQQAVEESLRAARLSHADLEQQIATQAYGGIMTNTMPLDPNAEIVRLRRELSTLRSRYTDEHPDVRAMLARIERFEKQMATSSKGPDLQMDPIAASLRARLHESDMQITQFEEKARDIEVRMSSLQRRVEETPRTEQQLAGLTRDYTKLQENYAALLKRKLDAQMAGSLEERWKEAHFRILDPANFPERPYFPPRMEMALAGILLGLAVGFGLCFLAESLDQSVKSLEDLEALVGSSVLVSVPRVTIPRALRSALSRRARARTAVGESA